MNHLRILKILNWINVGLLVFGVVLTLGVLGATYAAVVSADPMARAALNPTLAITAISLAPVAGMAVLALAAALTLESGRGRVPQTLLAIAGLTSVPLGTMYGAYALWVCWWNEETRAKFPPTSIGAIAAWLAFSVVFVFGPLVPLIGLSIAAVIPTNLAALDAEWEPFEDRSRRAPPGPGCGLTEVAVAEACAPAAPTGVRTEEVSFSTRGEVMGFTRLNGTLHLPEGLDGPRPAVILLHGSGPTDRDADSPGEVVKSPYAGDLPIFGALADDLARRGLVVLRWDKRSCGRCYPTEHEGADYSLFRFEQYLDDAQAAIDYLETRPEVRPGAIVVIGHSEGGGLAPHLAARDERVVAVGMLAGLTTTFRDGLLHQLQRLADIRRRQWDWLQAWAIEGMITGYEACLDRANGPHDPDDDCLGGGLTLRALAEYEAMNERTPEVAGALRVPLFAISGTVDRNVDPGQLVALREAAHGDAEYHLLSGVGHGLRNLIEPTDPPELDPRLLDRLGGFLASVHLAPPSPDAAPSEPEPATP